MQGDFQESFSPNTFLQNAYQNRKPFTDLYVAFSLPRDVDSACKKGRENLSKFAFYYMSIAALFSLIFLLTNKIAVIPIAVCIAGYYVSKMNLTLNNFEFTPTIVLYCCIGVNALLALISSSIAHAYLFFIALASICIFLIFGHACTIEITKDEVGNDI